MTSHITKVETVQSVIIHIKSYVPGIVACISTSAHKIHKYLLGLPICGNLMFEPWFSLNLDNFPTKLTKMASIYKFAHIDCIMIINVSLILTVLFGNRRKITFIK